QGCNGCGEDCAKKQGRENAGDSHGVGLLRKTGTHEDESDAAWTQRGGLAGSPEFIPRLAPARGAATFIERCVGAASRGWRSPPWETAAESPTGLRLGASARATGCSSSAVRSAAARRCATSWR